MEILGIIIFCILATIAFHLKDAMSSASFTFRINGSTTVLGMERAGGLYYWKPISFTGTHRKTKATSLPLAIDLGQKWSGNKVYVDGVLLTKSWKRFLI